MPSEVPDSLTRRLRALRHPAPRQPAARALSASAAGMLGRDSLSFRLRALHGVAPDWIVVNALHSVAIRPQAVPTRLSRFRGWRKPILALCTLLAINGVATYFAPVYAGAVGHLPGVGYFLRWSGLNSADLSTINVGVEHDGIGLHVSAGYADENATVLILDFHGPRGRATRALGGFEDLSLTDQFGHRYPPGISGWGLKSQPQPLSGQDVPGYATFHPITGPAAVLGARLTLTAHQFDVGSDAHGHLVAIKGTWELSFVLERRSAVHVHWAPAAITGASYHFNHVTITGRTIVEIQWRVTGPAMRAANVAAEAAAVAGTPVPPGCTSKCVPGSAAPPNPFQFDAPFIPRLIDATGREVEQTGSPQGGMGFSEDWGEGTFDYVVKPGQYRFVLSGGAGSSFERDLAVP